MERLSGKRSWTHRKARGSSGRPKPTGIESGSVLITNQQWTTFSKFPEQTSPICKSDNKARNPTTVILLQMKRRVVSTGRNSRGFSGDSCDSCCLNLLLGPAGSGPQLLGRLSQSGETKNMNPLQGQTFKNTTSNGSVARCLMP